MDGASSAYGERKGVYKVVGKLKGKRRLERPSRRWVDNIKTGFQETGWSGLNYVDQARDRDRWWDHVNAATN